MAAALMLALASALAVGASARAQSGDEGPVIVGESRERFRDFELDRFEASLQFYTRYLNDRIKQNGAPTRRDSELLFRESLGISTRAFIGHRNLIDLTADASLGFDDNKIDSDSQGIFNEHESDLYSEFNINALILGKGPAPVNVFARRSQSLLDRSFAGSIDTTTTELGANVRLFAETAPTTLELTHRTEDLNDRLGLVRDNRTEDTLTLLSNWRPGERQRLSLDYTLKFVDEQRRTVDTNYTRQTGQVIHELDFGPENEHDLRSALLFRNQSGDFRENTLRLTETLSLHHSDTLRSRYNLTLEDRDVSGQTQRLAQGRAIVRHELFASLVTTASAGASRTEVPNDDFTRDEFDADVNFEYTKRVPYGRFNASVSLAALRLDESDRGRPITIFDAPRTLSSGVPALLFGGTILEDSLVISDLSGSVFYTDGLDYTSTAFSDRLELLRIITGSIAEGQTVLVDYTLGPEPAATVDTLSYALAARYTVERGSLRGFSPYAEYRDVSQKISPAGSRIPIETTTLRYGADYRVGQLTFNGEVENRDSSVSPFDALRASARYDQRLGLNSYMTVNLSHEDFDFNSSRGSLTIDRAFLDGVQELTDGLTLRLRLLYRMENDSLSGDTTGFEQTVELNWKLRQTTMFLSIRNSDLETDDAQTQSQAIAFGLTRRF